MKSRLAASAIARRTRTSSRGFFPQLKASQLIGPIPSKPRSVTVRVGALARRSMSRTEDRNGSMPISRRSVAMTRLFWSGRIR